MSLKRIIARNATWSAAGMASGVVTGFITAPFLIHRLGQTTYGLWILIASLTSYFNLADLGLRASITRHAAFFRARRDQESVNAILGTAQAILSAAAVFTLVATFILLAIFIRRPELPQEQLASIRLALVLSGLTVAVTLALSVFDATLWAYERIDLLSAIEIAGDVSQTIILLYLVARGGSLVTVSLVVLVVTLCSEGIKGVVCFRLDRNLRISPANIRAWAARRLFGFGLWKFLWSIGNRASAQSGSLIIWARLAPGEMTPYSVASRLVNAARGISTAGTGVLTPTATALHAEDRRAPQQRLFVEGGKYCLSLSLFFATGIILLGKPFITVWMGGALASASAAAVILAVGEILPMSQWITYSILLGRDRHRVVACASFTETFVVIAFGLMLAKSMGLAGVCLAVAIPGTISRGLIPMIYGCRVLDVPVRRYALRVIAPPVLAIALPAVGLAALVHQRPPTNWIELFCYGAVFSFGYGIACSLLVVGPEQLGYLAARVSAAIGFRKESEVMP